MTRTTGPCIRQPKNHCGVPSGKHALPPTIGCNPNRVPSTWTPRSSQWFVRLTNHAIEDFRLDARLAQLNYLDDRSTDLYYSLVGELFDMVRDGASDPADWASVGRGLDSVSHGWRPLLAGPATPIPTVSAASAQKPVTPVKRHNARSGPNVGVSLIGQTLPTSVVRRILLPGPELLMRWKRSAGQVSEARRPRSMRG